MRATTQNEITKIVVDTSVHIHRELGPGLLESVYVAVLAHELRKRGVHVEREKPIAIEWDGLLMEVGFRADLVVEDQVLLELKSLESIATVHKKQILTYLRLANLQLGLLLNLGVVLMKDGIYRIVNGIDDAKQK